MSSTKADSEGYLILIVEDLAEVRMMKRHLLEEEGFRVVEAENGREGIELAIREQPRLILMNYLMPEMDGLKATKAIRRQENLKKVPIIMNSLYSKEEMEDAALQAGCNDYVTEPSDIDELIEKVHKYVLVE